MGVGVLELRMLGPVRAARDGRELGLGGPKQRAVLALLLVDAGRVVPAEYLTEMLWRGTPPPGASKTLRSYISRLRSLLGPEATLAARGGGYVITVGPDRVDVARFERLAGAGRDALGRGEAAAAASRFAEALALWRGRALADVSVVEPLALEAARLEELRLVALEGRIEADIERGRHGEVTGELEQLGAEHPVRERLWRLPVLALYRAERQADALAAYRRARQMLAEELGIEPGEELRRLEEAVLRQEVPPSATAAVTRTLPRDVAGFTGRGAELGRLLGALAAAASGGGWWGSARSAGWPGSARPPWRCTRRTGSRSGSPTGRCSCRCTRTPRGSGRWIPPRRWPACCWRPGSAPGRSRPAWRPARPGGGTTWRARRCCWCWTMSVSALAALFAVPGVQIVRRDQPLPARRESMLAGVPPDHLLPALIDHPVLLHPDPAQGLYCGSSRSQRGAAVAYTASSSR